MDKVIRKYDSFDAMKADEYVCWQELPPQQRMEALAEITTAAYRLKDPAADVRRLQRTLVRLENPER
jgi:hypothetical protein